MIYKKINATDEERIRVYNNVLEESPNIDYINPNTHTYTNDPGFEVIDNVDDNDHVRFFLDIDCDYECSPEEGRQKIINLIEDIICWLAEFINSDKSINIIRGLR